MLEHLQLFRLAHNQIHFFNSFLKPVKITAFEAGKKLHSSLKVEYYSLKDNNLNSLLIEHEFDCTIIASPDNLHYQHVLLSLQNNNHVLCVKPLVAKTDENRNLIHLQIEKNLLGMVEYHKRHDEANLYTKKMIDEGVLGDLLYYQVDYSQRIDIPMKTFRKIFC